MKDVSEELGLQQKVQQQTRQGHLLDLVLTNIPGTNAKVRPAISDHELVLAELKFTMPKREIVKRKVWL